VTFATESGDVPVESGELVRFAPGEFQLGRNPGGERASVLALGVPRESTEIQYRRRCETCGGETIQVPEFVEASNDVRIRCTGCGSTTDEIRR